MPYQYVVILCMVVGLLSASALRLVEYIRERRIAKRNALQWNNRILRERIGRQNNIIMALQMQADAKKTAPGTAIPRAEKQK